VGCLRYQACVNGLAPLFPSVAGLTLAFDSQVIATQKYSAAGATAFTPIAVAFSKALPPIEDRAL
jgi:hypothetical protein